MLAADGNQHLAERIREPDHQRADRRARDRADAAEHDNHEGKDQHLVAHAGIDRGERRDHDAAECGERDAGGEDEAIDALGADAERARHVAVLGRGAHDHADARPGDDDEHHRGDRQTKQADRDAVVLVGEIVGQLERAAQEFRRGDRMHVLAEQDLAHLVEHEDQPVAEQHLREMVAAVEPLDEQAFQREARHECDRDAAGERRQEAAGRQRQPVRHVGAEHIEGAVREVDDAEDAEHERQPARHEKEHEAVLDAVEQMNGEGRKVHGVFPARSARLSRLSLAPRSGERVASEASRVRGPGELSEGPLTRPAFGGSTSPRKNGER